MIDLPSRARSVIVMEGTLDIAAMGNLMATAANSAAWRGWFGRRYPGRVGHWRMGLTVYARSISPRTRRHYATVARNVPKACGGVTARPGDIIVADEDGGGCARTRRGR
jgi:regulator of RNase E activity RraA